ASVEGFHYGYGEGDQLNSMSRDSGDGAASFTFGPNGRIATRNGEAFDYDPAGRRTSDDRYEYQWDWRGRLYLVNVRPGWDSPYEGHQVRYAYDAHGRLSQRVHYGPDEGDGERGIIEVRKYLWEGATLLTEAGYGTSDGTLDNLFIRWRASYVPGASGLDDAVQVRIETYLPLEVGDHTYAFLRDELGSVMAVLDDEGIDLDDPQILARYLYTPFGEAHVESGPELRDVAFGDAITTIEGSAGTVEQTIGDPDAFAPGALLLTISLPLDEGSLADGLQLIDTTDAVILIPGSDYVIGRDPEHPEVLQILTLNGWRRSTAGSIGDLQSTYQVRLSQEVQDSTGCHLVLEQS
ncbi:MAG: hypothetical protein GY842_09340, partial [bacterium]|nr:hypothetical protein [bacterium]